MFKISNIYQNRRATETRKLLMGDNTGAMTFFSLRFIFVISVIHYPVLYNTSRLHTKYITHHYNPEYNGISRGLNDKNIFITGLATIIFAATLHNILTITII